MNANGKVTKKQPVAFRAFPLYKLFGFAQKLSCQVTEKPVIADADTSDWAGVPVNRINNAGHNYRSCKEFFLV